MKKQQEGMGVDFFLRTSQPSSNSYVNWGSRSIRRPMIVLPQEQLQHQTLLNLNMSVILACPYIQEKMVIKLTALRMWVKGEIAPRHMLRCHLWQRESLMSHVIMESVRDSLLWSQVKVHKFLLVSCYVVFHGVWGLNDGFFYMTILAIVIK